MESLVRCLTPEVAMFGARLFCRSRPEITTGRSRVILGLLIIAALASIPLTLTVLHYRESDALVIDMAGRQRMLLERYMKELLLAGQGSRRTIRTRGLCSSNVFVSWWTEVLPVLSLDRPASCHFPQLRRQKSVRNCLTKSASWRNSRTLPKPFFSATDRDAREHPQRTPRGQYRLAHHGQ